MRARVGDRLVVEGPRDDVPRRTAVVTDVRGRDGAPPYQVRWVDEDRETLVFPGGDAHIERGPESPAEE
ncbi:DUF1918 domain-containing protein [Salinactinospora qingdaonensis]